MASFLAVVILLLFGSCYCDTNTKHRTPENVVAALQFVRSHDVVMSARASDDNKTIRVLCGFDSFATKDTWQSALRDELKKKYDLELEIEAVK